MHARTRIFIGAAALFAAALHGLAAETRPVTAFSAQSQGRGQRPRFARGAPKDEVLAKLGMPSEVVSAELWIYREFRTDYQDANRQGYDTLLVAFESGRVQTMRVVNGEALIALLAAHRRAIAQQRVAAGGTVTAVPSMGYK